MKQEFKFPDVGEGIHEGRIVEWLIREGDSVREDQTILKVETDKAVVDLPSPYTGTVLKIHFAVNDVIHVGDVILTVGETGEEMVRPEPAETLPEDQPEPTRPKESVREVKSATIRSIGRGSDTVFHRPPATPHTRALARKLGVELNMLSGTGKGGRITDEDVRNVIGSVGVEGSGPALHATALAPAIPQAEGGPVERIPLTHLRKVIAESMTLSRQTSAHVTHVDEADVTDLLEVYGNLKRDLGEMDRERLTLMPFFIKAAIAALKDYPVFNASYDSEKGEILLRKYYNIGFAVDTPEGLIVPVIKNADVKSIGDLSLEVRDLAVRAKERKLSLEEIRGATFTLTNIGPIGGLFATPIIHQPELAILGTHTIKERPVVLNGDIVARKMMYTSISFDHRIIDGAEAARFMTVLVGLLSNPPRLMVTL